MVPPSIRLLFKKYVGIVPEIIGDSIEDLEVLPLYDEALVELVQFEFVTDVAEPLEVSQSIQQFELLP